MTESDRQRPTLLDEAEADPAQAIELAAARGAVEGSALLTRAFFEAGITQKELARRVGVTEGRVSQVLSEEVDLRLSTIARYLHAMGYRLRLNADGSNGQAIGDRHRERTGAEAADPTSGFVWGTLSSWQKQVPYLHDDGVGEAPVVTMQLTVNLSFENPENLQPRPEFVLQTMSTSEVRVS